MTGSSVGAFASGSTSVLGRTAPAFVLAVAGALASAWLVISLEIASIAVVASWVAVLAIATVPRVGLLVALALVLLFEPSSVDPFMAFGRYLYGGFSSTLGISEAIVSPLEILIVLSIGSWLLQGVARQRLDFRSGRLGRAMLVFVIALVGGIARGLLEGGDVNLALWECRFVFYAVGCYYLAANTVRTTRHVAMLVAIILVATGIFALEGTYRRQALINTGMLDAAQEFQYAHEDVIFLGVGLLLIIAQHLFGAPRWQRLLGLVFLPLIAYALLATERRAGFVALAIAVLALLPLLLAIRPRAFALLVPPLVLGTAAYLALFWNAEGLAGQPARAVRSLSEPDYRDAASNLYRFLETINVRETILQDPLLGVGFGRPFSFVVPLPDLSWWPFWHYEPHNNILWMWLKTGALGFIAFWALIGSAIARAAHVARRMDGQARVLAVATISTVVMTLVFSYVDLGLVSARVTVFLGTLMGAAAVLDQVPAASGEPVLTRDPRFPLSSSSAAV